MMKVRQPDLDFSKTVPHWTPNHEFAQSFNASSSFIPHLERFLNRVMVMARAKITGDDEKSKALRNDITIFIRQEANHYTMHAAFNEAMLRAGYDRLPEFEKEIADDFVRFLKTKSLRFLCAYCEGFETLGPPSAYVWLGEIEDLLGDADKNVVNLWKWHLMEEYEHRTVCHDIYHRLFGGYFYRIYGLIYNRIHLSRYSEKVRKYMVECDHKNMSDAEKVESANRHKALQKRLIGLALPKLAKALSPFYTPRNCVEPKLYRQYMANFVEKSA